jgi:hypothetical protein
MPYDDNDIGPEQDDLSLNETGDTEDALGDDWDASDDTEKDSY